MAEIDKRIISTFEGVIRELAMQRDMIIKMNVMTLEEVTDFINKKGQEYAKHYEPMSEVDIMLERLAEIAKHMAERGDK